MWSFKVTENRDTGPLSCMHLIRKKQSENAVLHSLKMSENKMKARIADSSNHLLRRDILHSRSSLLRIFLSFKSRKWMSAHLHFICLTQLVLLSLELITLKSTLRLCSKIQVSLLLRFKILDFHLRSSKSESSSYPRTSSSNHSPLTTRKVWCISYTR